MFIYLSKKIAIPNNTQIRCIAWNRDQGYIACGGDDGLLKVLKLEMGKDGKVRGLAAPSNLSMNQSLDGHNGTVQVVTWNDVFQKLTSSDQNGLIIVWMLYKGSWYEEMINNRNKSVVKGMTWSSDGQKICIVYEDGAVIVGSVDGNRIWGKELKGVRLSHVEWSPDTKLLLFGVDSTEIHIYEQNGNYLSKVPLSSISSNINPRIVGFNWYNGKGGYSEPGLPALAVAYDNGRILLMKNESDDEPLIIDTDMALTCVQWNHCGNILAATGKQFGSENEKKNAVKFYDPLGQHLHTLRIPGKDVVSCCWEGGGLRIALGVDSFVFFANIRPDYKWCYFSNTVVYGFTKAERVESTVMFWNTNTNDKCTKYVKNLMGMASCGDFCFLATKTDDGSNQYVLVLCNAIGTPLDSRYIEIEPRFLAMSESHIFSASKDAIYSWHYQTPKSRTILDLATTKAKAGQEKSFHIDDTPSGSLDSSTKEGKRIYEPTLDSVCCVTCSEKLLIIGRESGSFQRYTLPSLALTHRYQLPCRPSKINLNSNSTRMSIIDIYGVLLLYDLEARVTNSAGQVSIGEQFIFERRDVWDVKWASDNSEMFALMEKTRMYIFRGLDPEEPVLSSSYLCSFNDLQVKAVLLDDLMQDPENPNVEYIIDYEVKSLRDTRDLLEKVGILEASQFIEDNSHPRLWRLLAEAALQKMDFETAESAFVRCKDYAGIEFTKKVSNLTNDNLRKAEVAAYFKQFDDAEKLYLDIDRRDLAINLRRLLGDWFRVVQLLKGSVSGVDDRQLEEAWNAIGDYYADRQKWENAVTYYEHSHNHEKLAECYYMLEDYDGLQALMKELPENHKHLPEIASMFASVGMCENAVEAYIKTDQIKNGIDCCITLNQWNTAIELAKKHNIHDIDTLLMKYAKHLLEKKKFLSAVELYRKANRFLDAAKMMYKISEEESQKNSSPPSRLKKLYVLAALLVEEHKSHTRKMAKTNSAKPGRYVSSTINALLEDENLPYSDTRSIDQPWRGAEAYHFYLLAQKQLYEGYMDSAMKTSLHLREYEDVVNAEHIFCLLALASCANRSFGTASKAFIKLESLENVTPEKRQEYQDLSMEIFLKHSPKDGRSAKSECTSCETMIPDWCSVCPSCNSKFTICVVTGRPIMDVTQQWTCKLCKHSAFKQDMITRQHCLLCHASVNEDPSDIENMSVIGSSI